MSTDFTVVLGTPDRSLSDLVTALETSLVLRGGLRHDGTLLRCSMQAGTGTYDEISPEQASGPAAHISDLASGVAAWDGFACELWNEALQLYIMVGRGKQAEGNYVNASITISSHGLSRLANDDNLPVYYAALGAVGDAIGATAGYGHFEVAYEPLPPERAERAIVDLPDYPGEPATVGIVPMSRWSLGELQRVYGRTFDIEGTTAGYWVLANKQLLIWLGAT